MPRWHEPSRQRFQCGGLASKSGAHSFRRHGLVVFPAYPAILNMNIVCRSCHASVHDRRDLLLGVLQLGRMCVGSIACPASSVRLEVLHCAGVRPLNGKRKRECMCILCQQYVRTGSTLEDKTAPTNSPVFVQRHICRRRWKHGHVIMSAP